MRLNRIDLILQNNAYKQYLDYNDKAEIGRKFCRHNIEHALDVARISYIINLERKYDLDKEIIYAAALLHDIGRWKQYEQGIEHDIAGEALAGDILKACGFNNMEEEMIKKAIKEHGTIKIYCESAEDRLCLAIYEGDKASRICFSCKAEGECNWSPEKKNLKIKY